MSENNGKKVSDTILPYRLTFVSKKVSDTFFLNCRQ